MPDDDALLAANTAFYSAFNTRDMAAMRDLWSSRHPVTCVHPGWMLLTGHEEVMASWEAILANPDQPKIVSGGASVVAAGDLGVVTCRELVSGSPIVSTNVFVREEGRWRMVHHHASPIVQLA